MPIVQEIMSTDVRVIEPADTLRKAAQLMLELDVGALPVCLDGKLLGIAQVRRLPVINIDKELVGIVSLGDMALRQPGPVDQTVREISEPAV